jgi:hypothetical protein
MPPFKKGEGGRKKGGLNKKTIARIKQKGDAMAELIDARKPLAVTTLQKAMEFAEGAVSVYRPTMQRDIQQAQELGQAPQINPDGDHDKFGAWFDRWFKCITEMASYQSAKVTRREVPSEVPETTGPILEFEVNVFEGGKLIASPVRRKVEDDE